jgi:muramoyltetrapeptide carboxypeptidase LdcA involved in peptidoglycan recycling
MFAPVKNIGDQIGVISPSGKIKMKTWYKKTAP